MVVTPQVDRLKAFRLKVLMRDNLSPSVFSLLHLSCFSRQSRIALYPQCPISIMVLSK